MLDEIIKKLVKDWNIEVVHLEEQDAYIFRNGIKYYVTSGEYLSKNFGYAIHHLVEELNLYHKLGDLVADYYRRDSKSSI